jgi:hypothetical protein
VLLISFVLPTKHEIFVSPLPLVAMLPALINNSSVGRAFYVAVCCSDIITFGGTGGRYYNGCTFFHAKSKPQFRACC